MPLKNLKSISFTNGLEDKVSDVVILYCESNIWIHDLSGLLARVDVETSKNILWKRCVFLEEPLDSAKTVNLPAENVCFGGYVGFWQLYFSYKGEHFKLYKNNCKMTLSPECDKQELKIELSSSRNMKAKFQILTLCQEFKTMKGKCIANGVNVVITNLMDKDIDFINLVFTEISSSKLDTLSNSTNIAFDKDGVRSKDCTMSKGMLFYKCFGFKHYFKLYFTIEGKCYEIIKNYEENDFGIPIVLGEENYDHFLNLDIFKIWKKKGSYSVILIIVTTKSYFGIRKIRFYLAVMSEPFDDRKERIHKVYLIQRCKFEQEICDLIKALRSLDTFEEKGSDEANITEENSLMLFRPSLHPKLPFDEKLLNEKKIRIQSSLKSERTPLEKAIEKIDDVKTAWHNFITSLTNLLPLLGFLDLSIDGLHQIIGDLETMESMNVIDVLCQMLIPSGLDEFGLTFHTSKSDSSREISIDPRKLSLAIEEEVELWRLGRFSNHNKDPNLLNGTHTMTLKSEIVRKNVIRITELLVLLRNELMENFGTTAEKLHFHSRNVNISLITSSSLGFVGTGCAVTGLALAGPSAGVSTALTSTVMAVGLICSALEMGSKAIGSCLTKNCIDSLASLAANDQYVYRLLAMLKRIKKSNSFFRRPNLSGDSEAIAFEAKKTFAIQAQKTVISGVSNFTDMFICPSRVNLGTRNIFSTACNVGPVAASFILDLNVLAARSIRLSKGGVSKYGNKLEADILLLKKQLEECCSDK